MNNNIKNKRGWLVILSSFIIEIPTYGIMSSYGVTFVKLQEEFLATDLMLSWIASLLWTFAFTLAPVCTLLFRKFGHQTTTFFGVALCSLGLLTSSFVPRPEYLFLTFSFSYGLGTSLIEHSAINLIGEYFPREPAKTAFQFIGQSTGFLVMNPLMIYICNEIGWRKAFQSLSIGFAIIGTLTAGTFRPSPFAKTLKLLNGGLNDQSSKNDEERGKIYFRKEDYEEIHFNSIQSGNMHLSPGHSKESVALSYGKSIAETAMAPGMLIWNLGNVLISIPISFSYVVLLRYLKSIHVPESEASNIYITLGIFDILSRVVFLFLGDVLPFNIIFVYPVACISGGVVLLSLLADTGFAGLVVFAIVSGFSIGTYISMNFKVPLDLFGNIVMAEAWSLTIVSVGLGMLIGPILAGAIFDNTDSFQIFLQIAAICYFAAAFLFFVIPFWQKYRGWRPRNLPDRATTH